MGFQTGSGRIWLPHVEPYTYRRCEKRFETRMPPLLMDAQTGAQCQITVPPKPAQMDQASPMCQRPLGHTSRFACMRVYGRWCPGDVTHLNMTQTSNGDNHLCMSVLRMPPGRIYPTDGDNVVPKKKKKKWLCVCVCFNVQYLIFALQAFFPNTRACKCMSCRHTVYNK